MAAARRRREEPPARRAGAACGGHGLASSISLITTAVGLLAFAWGVLRPYVILLRRDAVARRPLVRMLRVGTPIGAQFMLEGGIFGMVAILMGVLGPIEVAAHHVALSMAALTFMVPLGISAAAAVLVGHAVGRADPEDARGASRAAIVLGVGFMARWPSLCSVFRRGSRVPTPPTRR